MTTFNMASKLLMYNAGNKWCCRIGVTISITADTCRDCFPIECRLAMMLFHIKMNVAFQRTIVNPN